MGSALRVLIAEDHEIHRGVLSIIFTALGCSVTVVSDGAEALAAGGDFDLICLDRHMPGASGPEVAAKLKGKALMVACTSDPSVGLDDFQMVIRKPVCCVDVAQAVNAAQALKRQRNLRRLPQDEQLGWPTALQPRLRVASAR